MYFLGPYDNVPLGSLSENEQEREVLDGFVGSATAGGADGHAGSALLQTRFADDFSPICTTTTIRLTGWVCCDTGVQAPKENRSSLGLPKRVLTSRHSRSRESRGRKLQRIKTTLLWEAARSDHLISVVYLSPLGFYIYKP